jgi:propionyl-CoA carboxylase alpha chain
MTVNELGPVLVANRGEIARRVFATCRRLGIETIAVFSDADAGLPFVREADAAARLPGSTPTETYLRGDLIIAAARAAGAGAIHPGYGFLSENADFARAVQDAGLVWIGPEPSSIEQMGSKVAAKKLMQAAGVPVLDNLGPDSAREGDLPLLVKASAGGGGRGMRIVRTLAELPDEIARASAEAESAFGDGTVFVEPYVEHSRHVEVQVLGDRHGQVLVLGERDCSIQRRHQKILEEAPAPGLSQQTRTAIHEAARAAAAAIGYVGAGTVEFLLDAADPDRFWFLEMNTRIQVEHPVTECVFGMDLVEQQIRIAEGHPVPAATTPRGHAVEVRLYAEDRDYRPHSGRLVSFDVPHDVAFDLPARHGLRLDSGFEAGNEVGTFYDAMLAKAIAWGPDRRSAFRALAGALRRARIHGVTTNRDLLLALLTDGEVLDGVVGTDLLERRSHELRDPTPPPDTDWGPFVAALALAEQDRLTRPVQAGVPAGWRNVVSQPQRKQFTVVGTGEAVVAQWYGGRTGYRHTERDDVTVVSASPTCVVLEIDRWRVSHDVVVVGRPGTTREVHVDSSMGGSVWLREIPRFVDPAAQVGAGSLLAPMPGTVIAVPAASGSLVEVGQPLLVLEAMKMQHTVKAPAAGVLELTVQVGQQVAAGDVLAVVTPDPDADDEGAQ